MSHLKIFKVHSTGDLLQVLNDFSQTHILVSNPSVFSKPHHVEDYLCVLMSARVVVSQQTNERYAIASGKSIDELKDNAERLYSEGGFKIAGFGVFEFESNFHLVMIRY